MMQRIDLGVIDDVILPTARRDLERAQHGSKSARALPVPALRDAVQQAGAIRITAPGGIEDCRWPCGRNRNDLTASVDHRTLGPHGDHQGFHAPRDLVERQSGALGKHPAFESLTAT